jgi:ATP-binding cassette, subfamily B, bacterial
MKFIPQHDQMDCGPACVCMIAQAYGKSYSLQYLRTISFLNRDGVSLQGISEACKEIGFETLKAKLTIGNLKKNKNILPCVLHWNQNHFVVLQKIKKNFLSENHTFYIADPSHGFIKLAEAKFVQSWISEDQKGVALFMEPTEVFYQKKLPAENQKANLKFLLNYLSQYKRRLLGIIFLMLIGNLLTLIFPFLTQSLIDKGVNAKDLNIVTIILFAQLGVFVGNITIEIVRNWLMLYIGSRISISIISDFLKKLLLLPLKFFDTKMMGDFKQRIQDNERIESFITSQSVATLFSFITFGVFFGVLWYYNTTIVLAYLSLTIISLFWSFYWLKKRKVIDYNRFQQQSKNQETIYEIINGVTEMKLNQFDDFKRKEWEGLQQKLFKTNVRILKIDQLQYSGFEFINQAKNILVTYLAATLVINNKMSLGVLLAISYIIGQLSSPISQLLAFFKGLQEAKISIDRLNEVQNNKPEELPDEQTSLQNQSDIMLNNVAFRYEGPQSPLVLKNINLLIPKGKITAIVGASGSGKTTLMKLLLKFYDPTDGAIYFNKQDILQISPKSLRTNCGVVMQDGFIFSDTIERNIAMGDEIIDALKLEHAVNVANLKSFIDSLPLKCKTKIGASGNGISGGQKQRILIARAVYKNPDYVFFDEATSSLDSENEKIIHTNLQQFFEHKTVVIIAHRLSTVKNADKIVVLNQGNIVEEGTHADLASKKGYYYDLVKNQLELGQ